MNVQHIPLSETAFYGRLMMDYMEGNPQLRPFYQHLPSMQAFPEVISERSRKSLNRELLAEVLLEQHAAWLGEYPTLKANIDALKKENTFTVTTGHQLCLATGPLYFLYKIITTINLCRRLKEAWPANEYVPVYWMASEDHDAEEINHFYVNGRKLEWKTSQRGAVGRFSTSDIQLVLEELKELTGNEAHAPDWLKILSDAYAANRSLSEATRDLVLSLFAGQGLVVLDADQPALKRLFMPVIREELSLQSAHDIVTETSARLGHFYKTQVTPRELNLFYLEGDLRERIVRDEQGHYRVLNTDLNFTRELMLEVAEKFPERFSPNVVLRPLYQESVLPNLAYVGGPGELAYWLQLKDLFDHYHIPYPMLVPRNNALIIASKPFEKFLGQGFEPRDVLRPYQDLAGQWLQQQEDIGPDIEKVRLALQEVYQPLMDRMNRLDPTLTASIQAELQKALNGLETLSKKGTAALKRKHEVVLNQLRTLTDKVNPEEQPQERILNCSAYMARYGHDFIAALLKDLHPLDFRMAVFVEP